MNRMRWSAAATAALCGVALSTARADELDVLITVTESDPTLLASGQVNVIFGGVQVPQRIFTETVTNSGADDLRGDEGFFGVTDPTSLPNGYLPMPPNVDIRFDFKAFTIDDETANLWFWDPQVDALPTFHPATNGMRLSFRKTPTAFFNATVDGADTDIAGFVIDRTGSGGLLHKHLTIVVDDADTDPGTPITPGVYVVGYVLSYSGAASEMIILVVNGGMGGGGAQAIEDAVAYFEDYTAPPAPCPGDLDNDGDVDITDLATLLSHFGTSSGATPAQGDLDDDGDVDISDLSAMLSAFGMTCD